MKLILQVLLGLFIFNTMLVLLVGYFPDSYSTGEDLTTDKNFTRLDPAKGNFVTVIEKGISIFAIFTAIGAGASYAFKSTIPLGAGMLSGLIAALWVSPAALISGLSDNALLDGLLFITVTCMGILIFWVIVNSFLGRST